MMFPLLMLLTAVRLLVAATTPLSPDEAYYWVWSHALAAGYPDHPPMVALWIRAGTWLAGDGPLGVRLLAPWAAAIGSVLLARTGALLLRNRAAGLRAAVLLNATLALGIGSVTMTPDTPLLLFWIVVFWALAELSAGGAAAWWLVAGAAGGLALDSKYTAALLLPAVLAWLLLVPSMRRWMLRPWPYLAAAMALALFAPVLAWNAGHGWVSFAKQSARTVSWQPARAAQFLGELIGGQIGLATPLLALLFGAGIALAARRAWRRDSAWTLLACLTLIPSAVFLEHALGDRVQANWPGLIYPAAAIAAAGLAGRWRRLVWPSVGLGLGMTALVWLQSAAAPFALPMRADPTLLRLGGWDVLERQVEAARVSSGASFVVSDNYGVAAELAMLLPPWVTVMGQEGRWQLFALPEAQSDIAGRIGLLVRSLRRNDRPEMTDWSAIAPLGEAVRARDGMTAEAFRLYRVIGRNGGAPLAVMPRPTGDGDAAPHT